MPFKYSDRKIAGDADLLARKQWPGCTNKHIHDCFGWLMTWSRAIQVYHMRDIQVLECTALVCLYSIRREAADLQRWDERRGRIFYNRSKFRESFWRQDFCFNNPKSNWVGDRQSHYARFALSRRLNYCLRRCLASSDPHNFSFGLQKEGHRPIRQVTCGIPY